MLFRQRKVFAVASGLTLVAALIYALAGTTYQANMKILVRRGRAEAPMTAGESAPLDLTRVTVTEEEINSEVELLRDYEVLRKVVQQTGAGGRDWFHVFRLWETNPERMERRARTLARNLKVEPVKRTNLITVSYGGSDPDRTARVLQTLANVYLAKHTTLHRPNGEFNFFEQQTAESRRQLEEAKAKLLQFANNNGIVVAAQQRDLALQKLSDVDASNRQVEVELAEMRRRVKELTEQVATLPERTTTQKRSADNADLLKALKASLLELQLKRTELLTKFEPNHRLVLENEQQIAQMQSAIAAENQSPVRDETTDKDPQYEWAKSELQRAQVRLGDLEARAAATDTEKAAYVAMAKRFGQNAIAQDDLLNSEKAAEENYLLYVKKLEGARMADALDERGIVNVAIAEQPVVPILPVWSSFTILAVGLVSSGVVGTATAFVADYLDPAFRDPDDVLQYLEAPLLASLPKYPTERLRA